MMRRINWVLGVLLIAQVVAAVALATTQGREVVATQGALLASNASRADTIVIADDTHQLKLAKRADGWHVSNRSGFPAPRQKVAQLLSSLQGLQARLPVATSSHARERFQVGKQAFARRITLKHDGERLATVYFGQSAGPGQVYARRADSNTIYEVRFKLWSASAQAGDWLDPAFLHQQSADLTRVALPDMTLVHKANAWQLADVAQGKTTAVKKAADAVSKLTMVSYVAMLGKRQGVDVPSGPDFAYTLVTAGGKRIRYRFYRQQDGSGGGGDADASAWLLTTSGSDYVFRVSATEVSDLRAYSREQLVIEAATLDEQASGGSTDDATARGKAGPG